MAEPGVAATAAACVPLRHSRGDAGAWRAGAHRPRALPRVARAGASARVARRAALALRRVLIAPTARGASSVQCRRRETLHPTQYVGDDLSCTGWAAELYTGQSFQVLRRRRIAMSMKT